MFGKIRGALVAAAVALFGLAAGAPAAKADFIYKLSVAGDFTGSGSIAFNTLGNFDSNFSDNIGITAFDFHVGSGIGSPQDYGLANVTGLIWTINPSTRDLTSLWLRTGAKTFGSSSSAITLSKGIGTNFSCGSVPADVSISHMGCQNGVLVGSRGSLTIALIPEPATMALFGAGLVALSMIARKRKTA